MATTTVSRRQFLATGGAIGLAAAGFAGAAAPLRAQAPAPQDLAFVNGRIHTMDDHGAWCRSC
jgi:hypothetical protein